MIFKKRDSLDARLQCLEQRASVTQPGFERQRLEKSVAMLKAGAKGEDEVAYQIDFHLGNNPNWVVIHDLRVVWKDRVAQIDHLLIDRFLQINVIESKSFRTKVRYAHGGWERLNFNHWEGIASPTDQNDRHILVLEQLIRDNRLAPTRLGFTMTPRFVNIVLVQPTCSIVGDYPADVRIHRADTLVKKLRAEDPRGMDMLKLISAEVLQGFAAELVAFHTPAPLPEIAIPKTPQALNPSPAIAATVPCCQDCDGPLSSAEAGFCRANTQKFGGRLLCRSCQSYVPVTKAQRVCESPTPTPYGDAEIAARCGHCGSGVDRKVVAFCRFYSKRFDGRVLCRTCQETSK